MDFLIPQVGLINMVLNALLDIGHVLVNGLQKIPDTRCGNASIWIKRDLTLIANSEDC